MDCMGGLARVNRSEGEDNEDAQEGDDKKDVHPEPEGDDKMQEDEALEEGKVSIMVSVRETLEPITYMGQHLPTVFARTPANIRSAMQQFVTPDVTEVGFDTEWKPTFRKGQQALVAVLQICTGPVCIVLQISSCRDSLPAELLQFMADSAITKYVHDQEDAAMLAKVGIKAAGFVDTLAWATQVRRQAQEQGRIKWCHSKLAVKKIAQRLGLDTPYRNQTKRNWEAPMDAKGLVYASNDAFFQLQLAEHLRERQRTLVEDPIVAHSLCIFTPPKNFPLQDLQGIPTSPSHPPFPRTATVSDTASWKGCVALMEAPWDGATYAYFKSHEDKEASLQVLPTQNFAVFCTRKEQLAWCLTLKQNRKKARKAAKKAEAEAHKVESAAEQLLADTEQRRQREEERACKAEEEAEQLRAAAAAAALAAQVQAQKTQARTKKKKRGSTSSSGTSNSGSSSSSMHVRKKKKRRNLTSCLAPSAGCTESP